MSQFFNRPPRIQPEIPSGEISIPNPPAVGGNTGRMSLITLFLPLLTIIAYSVVAVSSGRVIFVLPMGIAAIATSAVGYLSWRNNQENERRKQENYKAMLDNLRDQASKAHEQQRYAYNHNFPSPDSTLKLAQGPASRLWERRLEDNDFAMVRMGLGRMPASVTLKPPSTTAYDSPFLPAALKLASDFAFVQEMPISFTLRRVNAVGLTGANRDSVTDLARAMLVHLTGLHAPSDLRVFVIGDSTSQSHWNWTRWLPHANTSRNEHGVGEQLCFSSDKAAAFWEKIQAELERRETQRQGSQNGNRMPQLVVVVDMFTASTTVASMEEVIAETAVSTLLNHGHNLDASVIFLVPDPQAVPSECRAVLTVEDADDRSYFRYVETGPNAIRYEGVADRVRAVQADDFARLLAPLAVRTAYGAGLPHSLTLTDLLGRDCIEPVQLLERWRESRRPNDRWPEVIIGMTNQNKPRTLVFSADSDGIHGLVAGTTGTGKSELLITLVLGLALSYDPSVVTFALVDYKGGTAFEAFRQLPHTVDVITNLQGHAGVRAFTAIRAELNRRSELITKAGVRDIAEYRAKGFHETTPLPHLFIIIDEFAEMIKERGEFKSQLDSIARLGRALGVHLILATQRPSGVVSDQIRANMKFRLCLRVETVEDSRELLGRAEAAFLPANIPGRAYLQVGNENLELIQVAHAGGVYQGPQVDVQPPVIWLSDQRTGAIPVFGNRGSDKLSEIIIRVAHQVAEDHDDVHHQPKPWPDPLPEYLSLGDLHPPLNDWIDGQGQWPGIDWVRRALKTPIGLIDNPAEAEQRPLWLDLTMGHLAIFGAPGWGKTGLIRTLILGLAATHSPDELQMYFLDFGGRGLDVFRDLPHRGASIFSSEPERVHRLFRKLNNLVDERKNLFSQAQVSSLVEYNTNPENAKLPAILVVLDNFAELRENYPDDMVAFTSLARDGRAYGIHIVISAEQSSAVPPKVFSMFTERVALRMADSTEYTAVLGRGVSEVAEIAGRGFVYRDRRALEFQTALALSVHMAEESTGAEDSAGIAALAQQMRAARSGHLPAPIDILPAITPLDRLLDRTTCPHLCAAVGLNDLDLQPTLLDIRARGPHFMVIGPPLCGKTTFLRTWLLSLAQTHSPDELALVLIDLRSQMFLYGGTRNLTELPHVVGAIHEVAQIEILVSRLEKEFEQRSKGDAPHREIIVFIDNYDDVSSELAKNRSLLVKLAALAHQRGAKGLHFVIAGSVNITRAGDDLVKRVLEPRYGLGLDASDSPLALGARMRSSAEPVELPPGRGYLVKSGKASLIQVATPQHENSEMEASLDKWTELITGRHPSQQRSNWIETESPED